MALIVSGGGPCVFSHRASCRVRALASRGVATPKKMEEEKVKLGGSDVKVTKLGIGAWSWGDTTYWNDFQWDGTMIGQLGPMDGDSNASYVIQLETSVAVSAVIVTLLFIQQSYVVRRELVEILDKKLKAAKEAFDASINCGITFFDTAEVYGAGIFGAIKSETLIGRFIKEREQKNSDDIAIATKFAALPWRLGRQSVLCALKSSLFRLGLSSVDLYQLHWPGIWGNEGYIDGLGDAVEQGLVKAVGVSNYSEKRLRDAYNQLKKRGIPLASNQVNYSLLYRVPEENGVKAACDDLGVTLIAYSPIAQGVLSGKYTPSNPPTGPRGQIYTPEFLTKIQPLIFRIREIGQNYGRTPTQSNVTGFWPLLRFRNMSMHLLTKVVLNWLLCQENVVPIPGAKTAEQAQEFVGALGWRLSEEEVTELRSLASQTQPVVGFPVEKL